jgi:hypothetical protein
MQRSGAEQKMLDAMADPGEREALLDLLKNRYSRGELVSYDRLIECASYKAFDALLDFEFTVGQEADLRSK